MLRLLLLLAVPILLATGLERPAAAHGVLLEAHPADGAVLASSPAEIILRFNEPVSPIKVQVLDRSGRSMTGPEDVTVRDGEIRITLPGSLPDGSYLVTYRIISLDSHPIGGSMLFTVGAAAGDVGFATEPGQSGAGAAWPIAWTVNRVVFYLALMAMAGGAMFLALVGDLPPETVRVLRRRLLLATGLAAMSALLGLGLKGGLLADPPLSGFLDFETWRIGAASSLGRSVAVTLAGTLLLALVHAARPGPWTAALLFAGAVISVAGIALTGHSATAEPRWLMAPVMLLHTMAVAYWIGSLPPLLLILHGTPTGTATTAVRRFSDLALPAVAILLVAGALVSANQLGWSLEAVVSQYGAVLALKLALVALLLLLALRNKLRLTPALARGELRARAALAKAVRLEIGAAVLILGLTAVLGLVPPPRTFAAASSSHKHASHEQTALATTEIVSRGYTARLDATPGRAGENRITVWIADPAGQAVEAQSVTISFAQEELGIEPILRPMTPLGVGRYELVSGALPAQGRWAVRIDALVSDFEKIIFETDIVIE